MTTLPDTIGTTIGVEQDEKGIVARRTREGDLQEAAKVRDKLDQRQYEDATSYGILAGTSVCSDGPLRGTADGVLEAAREPRQRTGQPSGNLASERGKFET